MDVERQAAALLEAALDGVALEPEAVPHSRVATFLDDAYQEEMLQVSCTEPGGHNEQLVKCVTARLRHDKSARRRLTFKVWSDTEALADSLLPTHQYNPPPKRGKWDRHITPEDRMAFWMNFEPRSWQFFAVLMWAVLGRSGAKSLKIGAFPATGKTKCILWSLSLGAFWGWYDALIVFAGCKANIKTQWQEDMAYCSLKLKDILVVTADYLKHEGMKKLDDFVEKHRFCGVAFDEAHHASERGTYASNFRHLQDTIMSFYEEDAKVPVASLVMSGTDFREDGLLGDASKIVEVSYKVACEHRWVRKIDWHKMFCEGEARDDTGSLSRLTAGDLRQDLIVPKERQQTSLGVAFEQSILVSFARKVLEMRAAGKILVFVPSENSFWKRQLAEHGWKSLEQFFIHAFDVAATGLKRPCHPVHYWADHSNERLRAFRQDQNIDASQPRICYSKGQAGEGFDDPLIRTVVFCMAANTALFVTQAISRGTRVQRQTDAEESALFSTADNRLMHVWDLDEEIAQSMEEDAPAQDETQEGAKGTAKKKSRYEYFKEVFKGSEPYVSCDEHVHRIKTNRKAGVSNLQDSASPIIASWMDKWQQPGLREPKADVQHVTRMRVWSEVYEHPSLKRLLFETPDETDDSLGMLVTSDVYNHVMSYLDMAAPDRQEPDIVPCDDCEVVKGMIRRLQLTKSKQLAKQSELDREKRRAVPEDVFDDEQMSARLSRHVLQPRLEAQLNASSRGDDPPEELERLSVGLVRDCSTVALAAVDRLSQTHRGSELHKALHLFMLTCILPLRVEFITSGTRTTGRLSRQKFSVVQRFRNFVASYTGSVHNESFMGCVNALNEALLAQKIIPSSPLRPPSLMNYVTAAQRHDTQAGTALSDDDVSFFD